MQNRKSRILIYFYLVIQFIKNNVRINEIIALCSSQMLEKQLNHSNEIRKLISICTQEITVC